VRAGLLVDGVRFGAGGRTLDPAALLAPAGGLDP
jgi:purine-binding chemotaxis protein CheW